MFRCLHCGDDHATKLSSNGRTWVIVCAACKKENILVLGEDLDTELAVDDIGLETEELDSEIALEELEEPSAEFPWLTFSPEESFEEKRKIYEIAPEVDVPGPGPDMPTLFPESGLERSPKFYERNMHRLWQYGWSQIGKYMGDELYEELARPILTQLANVPETVESLYTVYGGSQLQGEFLRDIKNNIYAYLYEQGVVPDVGHGEFGIWTGEERNPERAKYVEEIVYDKNSSDYLGAPPRYVDRENRWLVNLLKRIRVWNEENLAPGEPKYVWSVGSEEGEEIV